MRDRQIGKQPVRAFIVHRSKKTIIETLMRRAKRDLISRGIIQDPAKRPPRYKFAWAYGNLTGFVCADDKSKARSLIKCELGIKKKHRLPIEVTITRTSNEEADEYSSEGTGENTSSNNRRA